MEKDHDNQQTKPFVFSVSARRLNPRQIVEVFERAGRRSELSSVFGFLDESPLNGGRTREDSLPLRAEDVDWLNSQGLGYSFTLQNLAARSEHLHDRHTNELLKRFENPLNSIIFATSFIADYIREHYPAYRLRASCLCDYKTAEEINAACERCDMVTPWPEVNEDEALLAQLKLKEKVMLFGTQACLRNCRKNRLRHYYFASLDHIMYYNHREYGTSYHAEDFKWTHPSFCRAKDTSVVLEDLERLRQLGFRHIKIVHPELFAKHVLKVPLPASRTMRSFFVEKFLGRKTAYEVR